MLLLRRTLYILAAVEVRVIPRPFLAIPRSPFLVKERVHPYAHLSIVFWLYMALQYRSSVSSNFLVFHTSGGFSSRPVTFLFLIFLSTKSSSSWVNCPCLISSWLLIIFVIGSSVTFGGFLSKSLNCCFHRCIRFSWLGAFTLALTVLFLLLTWSTVYHAILDCLFSTVSLILLIWFCMCYVCSFRYMLVNSFCAFLSFWALILVRFLLLHREAVFTLARFFLTANVSHGTLSFVLCLVDMHSAVATKWALTKFSYSSFGVFLISPKEHRICFLVLTFINVVVVVRAAFLRKIRRIFAVTFQWSVFSPSKEEYASQFNVLLFHFVFMRM